jgi:hypothetical protein
MCLESIEGLGAREGRGGSDRRWGDEWKRRRADLRSVRCRHWRQVKGRGGGGIVFGELSLVFEVCELRRFGRSC